VSLRVFDGGEFHESAVGSDSPEALRAAAKDLLKTVAVAPRRYEIRTLEPHEETWRTPMQRDPATVSLPDRAALVDREFERINWDDPRVKGARVGTEIGQVRRIFVGRGRRLVSDVTTIGHNVVLFGFDQGRPGFGFARSTGQGGLELAALSDAAIERMRRDFVESFGTESVPAGEYDVVFAPAVSGLLAHESFGHGVEMDQFVKDRAKAREYLNRPVAAPIVSLLDDPSIAGARGSYPFDDEGALAAPTSVIKDGVFVQPLTDLMSATFLGTRRTPNGRTQGWDRKVYARMSNTFIARGATPAAELLASLTDGLYLEGFQNGIEDPQGWGIQFTASKAREIKGGKFTGRVFAPATVTGYVPEILTNITMVGDDFTLEPGSCGKGFKEFIPVTAGGPHIRTRARVS
jgi:TldD protein